MKIIGIVMLCFSFLFVSCSKDSDDSNSNPLAPGIGGNQENSSVRFEVSHLESSQMEGVIEFYCKPSANVKISKVDVSVLQFTDVLDGDNQTVYQANQWYLLGGYEGVEAGQVWTFRFTGLLAENNSNFTVTSTYTVND
ncbi:MAG: hypothetical protein JEY94_16675 [Melioribacteraceae bacterium]|nr:hypothetical protein [Melioribacteraceae bacterium]